MACLHMVYAYWYTCAHIVYAYSDTGADNRSTSETDCLRELWWSVGVDLPPLST